MIKPCYALNAKCYAKSPSCILEKGKGMEEIAFSSLLFKKKEEGKVWEVSWCFCFWNEEGMFPNTKEDLFNANVTLNVMVYSLLHEVSWLERHMHEKEGKFGENGS